MSHCRPWPRAEAWLAAAMLWGVLAGGATARPAAPAATAERLVLAVTLDGVAVGEPVLVRRQGASIWLRAADLRAIGVAAAGDGDVALATVTGLQATIDGATQTLVLRRPPRVQRVRIDDPGASVGEETTSRAGWGSAINYDLTATRIGRRTGAAGLVDAVVFGPHGFLQSGAVVSTNRLAGRRHLSRLDTAFTTGDPGSARRLTLGDLVAGATENSRPIRMGGIQIATDFDLRPDLVTFPVPAIDGSAAVPSTLDLIVNGTRRPAGDVRAGQFTVTDVPVQTGINTITLAVRDALGRETRQTVSTYVARSLLRPGLVAFSAEAGWVRTGYATGADRYRTPAASASLRVGTSDRLTAEAHVEIGDRVVLATAGGSLGFGRLGLLSASIGASGAASSAQRAGVEVAVGFERVGRPVSVAARYVGHSRGWYDLAADGGAVTRDHSLAMTLGLEIGRLGTLGLTAIDQGSGRIARLPGGGTFLGPVLPRSRLVTATYSVRVGARVNLVANGGSDLRARRSGYVSLGALLVIGRRTSGYAGVLARAQGTSAAAEWGQVAIEPGDVGYRVSAARGGIDRAAADLTYQGARGFYAAQVERTNGVDAVRVSARGGVIAGGDGVLLTDRLTGSFAVVDTHGQAGVPVYRDNRRIGVTDRRGKLVVANLPAYVATRIALDPLALDPAIVVDTVDHWVRPPVRAGVSVRFAMRRAADSALVTLVGSDGAVIPAGSRAMVDGLEVPVGLDGALFLETPAASGRVVVRLFGGGGCVAMLDVGNRSTTPGGRPPIICIREQTAAR